MNTDFILEKKLKDLNPHYSELVRNTAVVMANILDRYTAYFPEYTDHSALHAMQVLDFCNRLIGDQIELLNDDEIFVLIMSCYMHDTGMGISDEDYKKFREQVLTDDYIKNHPLIEVKDSIRTFHHEFSGKFIAKYADIFEIPSKEHTYAIIQVARGHRKTDLYDPNEYPTDFKVPSGNTICLPFLAALIRLADELDIASDRNVFAKYDEHWTRDYDKHGSIKHMEITNDSFELTVETIMDDEDEIKYMYEEIAKLQKTLNYCVDVVESRTKFKINQKKVIVKQLD